MSQGYLRSVSPLPSPETILLRRTLAYRHGPNPFAAFNSTRTALLGFIGLNAAVFATWQYALSNRDAKLTDWLHQNFTASLSNYNSGRQYTLLTSCFSHQDFFHFAFNMLSFWSFGNILSFCGIGGPYVISLAIGSGIAGSAAWLYQQDTRGSRIGLISSALGASGVVMGVAAAATFLMPMAPMRFMLIPVSMPLWLTTLGYAGVDTYFLHSETSRIGHAAHLGGSIYGALFYLFFLRRFGGVAHMFGGRMRRH